MIKYYNSNFKPIIWYNLLIHACMFFQIEISFFLLRKKLIIKIFVWKNFYSNSIEFQQNNFLARHKLSVYDLLHSFGYLRLIDLLNEILLKKATTIIQVDQFFLLSKNFCL